MSTANLTDAVSTVCTVCNILFYNSIKKEYSLFNIFISFRPLISDRNCATLKSNKSFPDPQLILLIRTLRLLWSIPKRLMNMQNSTLKYICRTKHIFLEFLRQSGFFYINFRKLSVVQIQFS